MIYSNTGPRKFRKPQGPRSAFNSQWLVAAAAARESRLAIPPTTCPTLHSPAREPGDLKMPPACLSSFRPPPTRFPPLAARLAAVLFLPTRLLQVPMALSSPLTPMVQLGVKVCSSLDCTSLTPVAALLYKLLQPKATTITAKGMAMQMKSLPYPALV
jgi:hypothetical protein